MNTRSCCRNAAKWAAPSIGLALIPKCPACVAGYVLAFTGVGISMSMAARIRMGFLILCVAALVTIAVRQGSRLLRWSIR